MATPEYLEQLRRRNEEIAAELEALNKPRPPEPKNPSFLESAKAGFLGTGAMGLKALGYATGSEDIKNAANQVNKWSEDIAPQGPQDFTDILAYYGVGSIPGLIGGAAAAYAAPAVGITGAVGTGLASLAGASLANYPILAGSGLARQESVNEGVAKSPGAAFLSAIPAAALDSVLDALIVTKVLNVGGKALKAGDKLGNIFTKVVKGGATGAAVEVPTELGQQIIERAQAGLPLASPDAIEEYAEVAKVAGILGGTFGGAAGGIRQFADANELKRLNTLAAAQEEEKKRTSALAEDYKKKQQQIGLNALKVGVDSKFPAIEDERPIGPDGKRIDREPIGARYEYTKDIADRVSMFVDPTPGVSSKPKEPVFNLAGLGDVGIEVANFLKANGAQVTDTMPLRQVLQLPQELKQKVFDTVQGIKQNPASRKIPGKPYSERQMKAVIDMADGDLTAESVAKIARLFKKSDSAPFIEPNIEPDVTPPQELTPLSLPESPPLQTAQTPVPQRGRKGRKKQEQQTPVPDTAVPVDPGFVAQPTQTVSPEVTQPTKSNEEIAEKNKRAEEIVSSKRKNAVKTPQQVMEEEVARGIAENQAANEALKTDEQRALEARQRKEAELLGKPFVDIGSLPGRNSPGLAPDAKTSGYPFVDKPPTQTQQQQEPTQTVIHNANVYPALEAMGDRIIQMLSNNFKLTKEKNKKKQAELVKAIEAARQEAERHYKNAHPDGDSTGFERYVKQVMDARQRKDYTNPWGRGKHNKNASERIGNIPIGKPLQEDKVKVSAGMERIRTIAEMAQKFLAGAKEKIVVDKGTPYRVMFLNPWGIVKRGEGDYGIFNVNLLPQNNDIPDAALIKQRFDNKKLSTFTSKNHAAQAVAEEQLKMKQSPKFEPLSHRLPVEKLHPALQDMDTAQAAKPATETKAEKSEKSSQPKETKSKKKSEPKEPVKFDMDTSSLNAYAAGFKKVEKETNVSPVKSATGLKPQKMMRVIYKNGPMYIQPEFKKTAQFPYGDPNKITGYAVRIEGKSGKFQKRDQRIKTLNEAIEVSFNVARRLKDEGKVTPTVAAQPAQTAKTETAAQGGKPSGKMTIKEAKDKGWKLSERLYDNKHRMLENGTWRIIKLSDNDYRIDSADPKHTMEWRTGARKISFKDLNSAIEAVDIWSKPLDAPKNQTNLSEERKAYLSEPVKATTFAERFLSAAKRSRVDKGGGKIFDGMVLRGWQILKLAEGKYVIDNAHPKFPAILRPKLLSKVYASPAQAADAIKEHLDVFMKDKNLWEAVSFADDYSSPNQTSVKGKPVIPQAIGEYDDSYMGPGADDEIEMYSIKPGAELDAEALQKRKEGLKIARQELNKSKFLENAAYSNAERVSKKTKDGKEYVGFEGMNPQDMKDARAAHKKARKIFDELFPEDDGSSWENFVEGKALNAPRPTNQTKIVYDDTPKFLSPKEAAKKLITNQTPVPKESPVVAEKVVEQPVTPAQKEKKVRAIRAAVERDYDIDAARALLDDLVAQGIIEKVGEGTFRRINQARKYEAIAEEINKFEEENRVSRTDIPKQATRLTFEVRQITNPDRAKLADGSTFVLVNPKGNIVYKPGTLTPYTFKNAEDYKEKFAKEQAEYEKAGKEYFNYRQAVMRGEWPADKPKVEKPEPPKFVGRPVIAKYVKGEKDAIGQWIIDESANRWAVLKTGYGSDGKMISEQVESVRNTKEDAEADAAHYRRMAAGLGFSFTERDINQADRLFQQLDAPVNAPKTDAMRVIFAKREDTPSSQGKPLNVPPEQTIKILGEEMKNSSRMSDDELRKKYGDMYTAFEAIFNDVFGKTGLEGLGVQARIVDLIKNNPSIQGSYRNKLISVAFAATIDPKLNERQNSARIASVLTHEVFHAFKAMGAFTDEQYQVLAEVARTRKAHNGQTYMQNAMKVYDKIASPQSLINNPAAIKKAIESIAKKNMNVTPDTIATEITQMSKDMILEEAIAEMAADWAGGKVMPAKVDGFFTKIINFFKALFRAGQLSNKADSIFEDMSDGTIAKRTSAVNSIDGTKFSIKVDEQYTILVHRSNLKNYRDKKNRETGPTFLTVLQVVNSETGAEKARAEVEFKYNYVNLNDEPSGDNQIVNSIAEVHGIAAAPGETLSKQFVRSVSEALSRKLKLLKIYGDRASGAKANNRGPASRKKNSTLQEYRFVQNKEDLPPDDYDGKENFDDAVLFDDEDFMAIGKHLEEDEDSVLKYYNQDYRLAGEQVRASLDEGIRLRNAVKQSLLPREALDRIKDRKEFAAKLGVKEEDAEFLSLPQLLLMEKWSYDFLKRSYTAEEVNKLVRLEMPDFMQEYTDNYAVADMFREDWDLFAKADPYFTVNGFSGEPIDTQNGSQTDGDYIDELYSIKDIAAEDAAYAANADMSLDPFGNLNDGLGERLRPAATTNHQNMWDRDYAYTITLRHIQAFANRMTPAMVKRVFGFTKEDVDLFVQKVYTSFVDANLPIAQVVDLIRKAGGYVDDRFDPYLQAELKSDEIIPEIERVRREHVEPIVQYMVENGISLADANDYLNAMHAPERNELIRKRRQGEINKAIEDQLTPSYDAMYGSGTSEEQAYAALMALQAEGKVLVRNWVNDDGTVVPNRLESYGGKLHEFGKLFQGLISETNKIRELNGLIPSIASMMESESYPNFRYYAPLKSNEMLTGDENIDDQSKARVGVKYGVSGLEDKHATGRHTKASRILENAIMQNYEAIIRSKRANVGQAFHEFVMANQDKMIPYIQRIDDRGPKRKVLTSDGRVIKVSDHKYKTDPRYFVTKIDGNEVVYEFTDDGRGNLTPQAAALSRALRGFARPSDANSFVKGLQWVNQMLAKLNTAWNPEFTVTNLIRDLGLAMFNIGQYDLPEMQRQILKNWKPAYKTIRAYDPKNILDDGYMKVMPDGSTFTDPRTWTDEQMYHALRSYGGLSSFYERMDLNQVSKQLTEDMKTAAGVQTKPQAVLGAMKKVVGAVENWNTAIEHATRMAAFKAMLNQGVPIQRAAQATKNLTVNFNKGGEQRVLLNALYLFYNASIQGTMAMMNAIHRSPKLMRAAMYLTAAGFLADLANDALSDEEEDGTKSYDLLKSWKKESAINIPMGGGQYFSIPLPWGLSFFWNIGRASAYAGRTGDVSGATLSMMSGLVSNFSPIGTMENMANFFAPTILDPIINVATNTSWDGRPIQPTNLPFGPQKPNSQLYWNSTSGTMKSTAELFNELSGGDEFFPGMVDISPEILDYGTNFLMGGAGMFVIRNGDLITDALPRIMAGEDWEWNEIPFFRRVVTGTSKRSTIETYSKNLEDVVNKENALKQIYLAGDTERAAAFQREYGEDIAKAPMLKSIQSARSDIKSQMKLVDKSKDLSSEEKSATMKRLREAEMQLIYQANRIFKQRNGE